MSTPIGKSNGTSGTTPPAKPQGPAAPKPAPLKLETDSFLRNPPNAAQLAAMRAAVAAVDGLPPLPKGIEAQKAWIEQVRPTYEAAEKAISGMRSASFFHKSLPDAEVDAASDKVNKLGYTFRDAEEATGLREPVKPADPKRPTFGASKSVSSWMGNNGFTALIGLFALPVAAMLDAADAVSRPAQAKAYPEEMAKYNARKKLFEEQQAKKP